MRNSTKFVKFILPPSSDLCVWDQEFPSSRWAWRYTNSSGLSPLPGLTGTCQHESGERAEKRREEKTEGGGETAAWQRHELYTNVSRQFIHLYLHMFQHPVLILLFLSLLSLSVCMEITRTSHVPEITWDTIRCVYLYLFFMILHVIVVLNYKHKHYISQKTAVKFSLKV